MRNWLLFLLLLAFAGVQAQVPHEPEFDRLLALNRYYQILQRLDSLQKEGKDISSLYYYGGKANEGIMRYNQAYTYYLKWYESDTTQQLAQFTLARIASLAGHRKEAMKRYEQLAQQDSLNFTVNYSLGRLYQQSGRVADALRVYRRQWEVDTTNITLLTRMGDCLADAGMAAQAFPLYLQAFDLDVQNSGLAVKMVNGLISNRDLIPFLGEQVERAVDTVATLAPALTNLRQSQGILKYILKKYGEAQLVFSDLLEQKPVSKITYKFLGFSLSQQHRYHQARRYLHMADSLYRDAEGNLTDLEVGMRYAETLSRAWKAKEALEILEEVWEKLQPDPRVLSQIFLYRGMAFTTQGKKGGGRESLLECLP